MSTLSFHACLLFFAIVQLPSITDSHAESCMQLLHYSCTYIQCIYRRAVGWISKLLSIIIYTICADSDQEVSLTINEVAVICTTVTFILAILSGCVCGALLMYWLMRTKAVYSPAAEGQVNVEPTASVDPVYEEVSPKQEIELNTNQAYGPVGR